MRSFGPLPELDATRCTGCGDCVPACPTGCLEMLGPLPWMPRPLDCTSCSVCVWICPESALSFAVQRRKRNEPGTPAE